VGQSQGREAEMGLSHRPDGSAAPPGGE
jgi:hypothetical protein